MTKLTWLKRHLALPLGLTAAVVLASCGQSDSPAAAPTTATQESHGNATGGHTSTSSTTSPAGTSPSTPAGQPVEITVKGKQVTPRPHSMPIKVGEKLTIAVTSDHDDTLHAHGFNITKIIKANQQVVFEVTGAKPGLYEVELHDPPLRILQIAVS